MNDLMKSHPRRLRKRRALPLAVLPRHGLLLLALLLLYLAGCHRDLDTEYGQRSGPGAATSVNGTAVLSEMFEQAGHKVTSWTALSPRLSKRADCIVWFPDDFQPPSKKVRRWLEHWLHARSGRTLVYVGRDFDAAPWYWEKICPLAPAAQADAIRHRLRSARDSFQFERHALPNSEDCQWFTVKGKDRTRAVRTLSGEPEWLADVAPAKVDIELVGRLQPLRRAYVLLASRDDALVSKLRFGDSQLILVANGSFLLNAMLVNHEHRKLAGALIDCVGESARNVVFLESGSGGPPISDQDPSRSASSGLEVFHLWPTNWILLHLAAVGIIFCFSRWPLFGQPRQLEPAAVSDFGRHVDALAELLSRSHDHSYAMSRVLHYQQISSAAGRTVGAAAGLSSSGEPPNTAMLDKT
jgi:hypothetical protein